MMNIVASTIMLESMSLVIGEITQRTAIQALALTNIILFQRCATTQIPNGTGMVKLSVKNLWLIQKEALAHMMSIVVLMTMPEYMSLVKEEIIQ